MSRKVRIGLGVAAVLLVAGVVGGRYLRERSRTVTVQTGTAARRDLVSVVSASGEVKPKRYVNISANVSGRITALKVKEGETVKRNQVLARIDSTRFEAATQESEAGLSAAQAELRRAEADVEVSRLSFDRTRRMHEQALVSDQQFEQAEAEYKMRQAVMEAQKKRITQQGAAVTSNRDDLGKTVVMAPMDGVVTSLQKEEGEMVIGAQSFQPTVVMTVADLSVMEVEIMVDETDIRSVAIGQPAKVRVDALEGVDIAGEVTEIGSSAIPRGSQAAATTGTTSNQAKDFKVTVTLKEPPAALRPGLNATADITVATKKNVLAVPIQAVVVRQVDKAGEVIEPAEGGPDATAPAAPREKGEEKEGVFVIESEKARFRPVKTGIVGETDLEVVTGIKDGEEIVTGSYKTLRTLKNDAKIRVDEKGRRKERT